MPSKRSAGAFRPFAEQDAACIRHKWEATFPSLIDLLNSRQNQPPVRSITLSKLSVRPVRVQRDVFERGGQPKDYDINFDVEFEDKSVVNDLRSAADLVRGVGRKWGLGEGLEAVIFPSAQWISAKAVTRHVVFIAKERRAALARGASGQRGEMTSASAGGELGSGAGPSCENSQRGQRKRGRGEAAEEGGMEKEGRKDVAATTKVRSKRGRRRETLEVGAHETRGAGVSGGVEKTGGAREVGEKKSTEKRRKMNVTPEVEVPTGGTLGDGGRRGTGVLPSELAASGVGVLTRGSQRGSAPAEKLKRLTAILDIRRRTRRPDPTEADAEDPNEPPTVEEASFRLEPDRWVPTSGFDKDGVGPVPVLQSKTFLPGDVTPAAAEGGADVSAAPMFQGGGSGVTGMRDADGGDQGREAVQQDDVSKSAKGVANMGRSGGGATPSTEAGGMGEADSGGASGGDSACPIFDRFRKPGAKKKGLFKRTKSRLKETEGPQKSSQRSEENLNKTATTEVGPVSGGVFTSGGIGERGTGENVSVEQGGVFTGGSGAPLTPSKNGKGGGSVNAFSVQGTRPEVASGQGGLWGRGKRKRKPLFDVDAFCWPARKKPRPAPAVNLNEGLASEPAPTKSEPFPDASTEPAPGASEPASTAPAAAPGASAPTRDASEAAPVGSAPSPDTFIQAPGASELAPGASVPAIDASEAAPSASEPAPGSSEPGPTATEPVPTSPGPASDGSGPSPDVLEHALEASGTDPGASESALEASILLGETAGNAECGQQLFPGERELGSLNLPRNENPPQTCVAGGGDVPVGVPGGSKAEKQSARRVIDRALEGGGCGASVKWAMSLEVPRSGEPAKASPGKRQRRKECVPKERGPLSGVPAWDEKSSGGTGTLADAQVNRRNGTRAGGAGEERRRSERKTRAGAKAPLAPQTPAPKKSTAWPKNLVVLDGSDDEATPSPTRTLCASANEPTIPFSLPGSAVGSPKTCERSTQIEQPKGELRQNQHREGEGSQAGLDTAESLAEDGTVQDTTATNLAAAAGLWSPAKTPEPSERTQPTPLRTPEPSEERRGSWGPSPSAAENGHVEDWYVAKGDVAETGLAEEPSRQGRSGVRAQASAGSEEIGGRVAGGLDGLVEDGNTARGDHPGDSKGLATEPGTAAKSRSILFEGAARGVEAGWQQPGMDGETTGHTGKPGEGVPGSQPEGKGSQGGDGSVSEALGGESDHTSAGPSVPLAGGSQTDAPESPLTDTALPFGDQELEPEEKRTVAYAGATETTEAPQAILPGVEQTDPRSGGEGEETEGDATEEEHVAADSNGVESAGVGDWLPEVGDLGGEAPLDVGEGGPGTDGVMAEDGSPSEEALRSVKAPAAELSDRPEPGRSAPLSESPSERPPEHIGHPVPPASLSERLAPSCADKQPETGAAKPSVGLSELVRSENAGRFGLSKTPADLSGSRSPQSEIPNRSSGLPGSELVSGEKGEDQRGRSEPVPAGGELQREIILEASTLLQQGIQKARKVREAMELRIGALSRELEGKTKEVTGYKEREAEWKRREETLRMELKVSMQEVERGKSVLADFGKRTAAEKAELESSVRDLRGQVEEKEKQVGCLEEALRKQRERAAELETQLEAVRQTAEARGKLEAELTSARADAASAREELMSVREALRRATERAAADSEAQRLEATRATAEACEAMRKLETELTSARADAASAREEVRSVSEALRRATERAAGDSAAQQIEAARATADVCEAMRKLETELTSARAESGSARAEVTSLKEALEKEAERVAEAEAQQREVVREMAEAREAMPTLELELALARAEVASARAEVTSLRALVEEETEDLANSQSKATQLEQERNAALERAAELEREVKTALQLTEEVEAERDEAVQQNEQLEKRWNDALPRRAQVAREARTLLEEEARAKKEAGSVYGIMEQIEEGLRGELDKKFSLLSDLRCGASRVVVALEGGLGQVVLAGAGKPGLGDAVRLSRGTGADVAAAADVIEDGGQALGGRVVTKGTVSRETSEGGLPCGGSTADACVGTDLAVWEGHVAAADVIRRERNVSRKEKEELELELRLLELLRGLESERESARREIAEEKEGLRRKSEEEVDRIAELQKIAESKYRAQRNKKL
ncbi:hypothetical protein KFL_004180150 [Klebsormidium nitens]|uniref:Uncharacterized protein n=1 Tax=Klebsormidium nitens TaxID=105231 RepID=A0A1Y1IFR1_KLENI|nr:hypothetical protein KFL_004180150 [Klebsormidium nitens]|eukprot:GAQ88329.1 hypothetical protein KFL_004180150 [Klebsormidium nitens]